MAPNDLPPAPAAQDQPRYPDRDRNALGQPENARPRDRYGAPLPRGSVDEMAHREEPADVVGTVAEALDRAIELFDQQRFFEAHEFLEYVWKSDDVPEQDRDFWKGVTQVAVGCCHIQRGNDAGAATLLERAASYLAPFPETHAGVAAEVLAGNALRLAADVRRVGSATAASGFFAFPRDTAVTP